MPDPDEPPLAAADEPIARRKLNEQSNTEPEVHGRPQQGETESRTGAHKMIDPDNFSKLKFLSRTETLGATFKIPLSAVLPMGSAVESRVSKIKVIYVPDNSREIDRAWLEEVAPKNGDDLLKFCQAGFADYEELRDGESPRKDFLELLKDPKFFGPEALSAFEQLGFPAFFEICSIEFIRGENAVIIGGCLEDYFHLAEHGVDILWSNGKVEFGGNCEFNHLYESAPWE